MNPLSAIYAAGVGIRNLAYDRDMLTARKLSAPVISVGNISAGGAGKTPFVILIGEFLKRQGIPFDVLSRGYGRTSYGVHVVDPAGSPQDFGDEPLLIARRLGCTVVIGENRYEAGIRAEHEFGPQLHLLDDGFQHRGLARDLDIVLLTPEDLEDRLLPFGKLREPFVSLRRADVIAAFGDVDLNLLPVSGKATWRVRRGIVAHGVPKNPIAFCGIARPQRFFEQLKNAGIEISARKVYRDHHAYLDSDVKELIALRNQKHAGGFIITEKDAINLGPHLTQLGEVAVARVTMEIVDPPDALDTILRLIDNRTPQREKISGQ